MHTNGNHTEMKVDTGAKCNGISQGAFNHVANGGRFVKRKKAAKLVAYGGSKLKTTGRVTQLASTKNSATH